MADLVKLEAIASDLIKTFEIQSPPIPVEIMLQRPKPDMWKEVDITELSVGFLRTNVNYSPRMSLARLLVRHIARSEWGERSGLTAIMKESSSEEEAIHAFARMLVMPIDMIKALNVNARTPVTMGLHFEVPEEEARLRLTESGSQL